MEKIKIDLRGLTLVVVTGAWLAGIVLGSWLPLSSQVLLSGIGAALICVILFWRNSRGRLGMLIVLWLLLGAWRYSIVSPSSDQQAISRFIGAGKVDVKGSVTSEPTVQGRARHLLITVSSIRTNGGSSWQDAHGQLEVETLGTNIDDPYGANYGDAVELQGKLQSPLPHKPPAIFASMTFPRIKVDSTGGIPIISSLYHLRTTLAAIIAQSLPQPEAALLIALLLSMHTPALKPLIPIFNETGTAHLIAPSGFKVTVLAGLVTSSTRWLYEGQIPQQGFLLPAEKRKRGWRRWLVTVLVTSSIAMYTVLSGAGPAAIRAGMMGTLLVVAPRIGRIYNIYTALALVALLMSMHDPFVLWDAGFQLSLLGTLGIVRLTSLFQRLLHPLERLPFGHYLVELTAVTLAAQVATLPILADTFNQISPIAPLANMLTVPLLGMLILLGLLLSGAGLFFAPLGVVLGWAVWPPLWYLIHIVTWCAGIPGSYLPGTNMDSKLVWCYYGVLGLITSFVVRQWPIEQQAHQLHATFSPLSQRTWRLVQLSAALVIILATGATALAAQPGGQLTITFLSVAPQGQLPQGEAILIHTPDGKIALIDGGLDASSIDQELDSRLPSWQRSLDMVILTTPRADSITGLLDVIRRYDVGMVLDAGVLHPTTNYALWRRTITERNLHYVQVRQGTSVPIGTQVMLQILSPPSILHKGTTEVLDNTLIMRLVAPGLRMLLLGAAALSKYALNELSADIAPDFLQANVVQIVGEAGKGFPTELDTVLQKVHPSFLVITHSALSPRQRKSGKIPPIILPSDQAAWQVMQTAQVGTMEVSSDASRWSLHIT